MGLQVGNLIGGSILIETVFAWPGTGFLLNSAIFRRDLPVLQGTTLVLAGVLHAAQPRRGRDPDHGRSAHQAGLSDGHPEPSPSTSAAALGAADACARRRAATGGRSAAACAAIR